MLLIRVGLQEVTTVLTHRWVLSFTIESPDARKAPEPLKIEHRRPERPVTGESQSRRVPRQQVRRFPLVEELEVQCIRKAQVFEELGYNCR